MRQRSLGLALLPGLMLCCVVRAAEGPAVKAAPSTTRQMYEDIEVLRRLLNRSFQETFAQRFVFKEAAFTPDGKILATANQNLNIRYWDVKTGKEQVQLPADYLFAPLYRDGGGQHQLYNDYLYLAPKSPRGWNTEGAYLKGCGVVYTVTLPPPARDPRPAPAPAATKQASDWERVRKQVRGEKTEPVAAQQPSEPPLADAILKLLADNGHHFTQLGEQESLTVVVTFRPGENSASASGWSENSFWIDFGFPVNVDVSKSMYNANATADKGTSTPPSSARDYELLGDLHEKQGRIAEALAAYQKAVELVPDPKTAAALYRKLARAWLAQANEADAAANQKAVARALDYLKRLQETQAKAVSPSAPAPVPLPAKLTISAPKKLLDLAGSGKITLEEFKKAATVEYLTFPAEKPSRP